MRQAGVAGHFGEYLQGRIGVSGPVALVTLPCPMLRARAVCLPSRGLTLWQNAPAVSLSRLARMLDLCELPRQGRFRLHLTMPLGGGAGASTAALMALAQAAGADDAVIPMACLAVEGASDPMLMPNPAQILWASRQGRMLAPMPALPRHAIIGGFWGQGQRTDPQDHDFPDISDLIPQWQTARTLTQFASLASQSAQRCLALRGPAHDPTASLSHELGAQGFTIAHTGSARALIFAPGTVPETAVTDLRAAGFSRITRWTGGG